MLYILWYSRVQSFDRAPLLWYSRIQSFERAPLLYIIWYFRLCRIQSNQRASKVGSCVQSNDSAPLVGMTWYSFVQSIDREPFHYCIEDGIAVCSPLIECHRCVERGIAAFYQLRELLIGLTELFFCKTWQRSIQKMDRTGYGRIQSIGTNELIF